MNKEEALQNIVSLAHDHALSIADISKAITDSSPTTASGTVDRSSSIVKVLSYFGGILIFSGLAAFISLQWDSFTPPARVIVTLGSGFAFYITAVVYSFSLKTVNISKVLFCIAAVVEPAGLGVLLNEYFPPSNDIYNAQLFISGVMLLQFGLTFLSRKFPVILFFALIYLGWFLEVFLEKLKFEGDYINLIIGITYLVICSFHQHKKICLSILPIWFTIGSAFLFYAGFEILDGSILFLLLLGWILYLSTVIESNALLLSTTVATLSYIGYYTNKYFIDSLGWPIALVIMGIICIFGSILAVRFSQKYIKK